MNSCGILAERLCAQSRRRKNCLYRTVRFISSQYTRLLIFARRCRSVNVISPIITSSNGLFRQTTFFPLHLFSNLMRGSSLDAHVSSPTYDGETDQSLYAIWMPTSPKRRKAPNLSTSVLFCRMTEQRPASLSLTIVQMKNLPFRSYLGPWILMWGSGMRWRYTKCGIKICGPRMDSKKVKMSRLSPGQKLGKAVMCWRNTLFKVSEISSISCYTVNTDNYPSFSYCIQVILR